MNNKGFTLIEAAVSITIFSVVAILLGQIMVTSIKNQIKITYTQTLLNETGFILDYISKDVRMAKRADDSECVPEDSIAQVIAGGIRYLSYNAEEEAYKCKEVYLSDNAVKQKLSTDTTDNNFGNEASLSSNSVIINELLIGIQQSGSDTFKERVNIKIDLETDQMDNNVSVVTETSVAPRN
jgi:prepilin-type N-terminal cleavage/methylation domain-containing protein